MASALIERCDDRIAGVLSCYDRVVVTGTLPTVCHADGMTRFLYASQIRIFDCPEFAVTLRDRVREAAASLAADARVAIEHVAKSHVRKEAIVAKPRNAVRCLTGSPVAAEHVTIPGRRYELTNFMQAAVVRRSAATKRAGSPDAIDRNLVCSVDHEDDVAGVEQGGDALARAQVPRVDVVAGDHRGQRLAAANVGSNLVQIVGALACDRRHGPADSVI
jgi:hypothetical protein